MCGFGINIFKTFLRSQLKKFEDILMTNSIQKLEAVNNYIIQRRAALAEVLLNRGQQSEKCIIQEKASQAEVNILSNRGQH